MGFADRLQSLMQEKKVSRNKLALDLNLSKSAVYDWVSRGNIPNGEVLKTLSEYFNVDVNYLICESTERTKKAAVNDSSLSKTDYEYLMLFKSLPPSEQQRLLDYGELLLLKQKQSQSQ